MKRGPKPGLRIPLHTLCEIAVKAYFGWPQSVIASDTGVCQQRISIIALRLGLRRVYRVEPYLHPAARQRFIPESRDLP